MTIRTTLGEILFDNDERIIVNGLSKGENLQKFSKNNLLTMINFQLNIVLDDEMKELLNGVRSKVNKMTEEEWEEVKQNLPIPCFGEEIDEDEMY